MPATRYPVHQRLIQRIQPLDGGESDLATMPSTSSTLCQRKNNLTKLEQRCSTLPSQRSHGLPWEEKYKHGSTKICGKTVIEELLHRDG